MSRLPDTEALLQVVVPVQVRDDLNTWAQAQDLSRSQLLRRVIIPAVQQRKAQVEQREREQVQA